MKNSTTRILLLASIIAVAVCQRQRMYAPPMHGGMLAGGFANRGINELTKKIALDVIQKTNEANSGSLETFLKSEKKLVKYSTQVVAGINYGLVYLIESGENSGKYECFKIYKALDGFTQVSFHAVEETIEDAETKCNLPHSP